MSKVVRVSHNIEEKLLELKAQFPEYDLRNNHMILNGLILFQAHMTKQKKKDFGVENER